MKLLAISGSLKSTSRNSAIVRYVEKLSSPFHEVVIYNNLCDLPHFNPEIDLDPPISSVVELRKLIASADAVLLCTPEYAYGVPGSLKNMLDWTVSSGEFLNKPVAAISASPLYTGGEKALASLLLTLEALSSRIPEQAKLSIAAVNQKINEEGIIVDPETITALKKALEAISLLIIE